MTEWTVEHAGTVVTVGADPGVPVTLVLAADLGEVVGEGKVAVKADLSVEQVEQLRTNLAAAIGIAQDASS